MSINILSYLSMYLLLGLLDADNINKWLSLLGY